MKIYLALPISGRGYDDVVEDIFMLKKILENIGYEVLQPMTAKGYLRTEVEFKAHGYDNPVSTNHAIAERDKWMVQQSDIILMDLSQAKSISIGCMMELAWGALLGKHTIVVMGEGNPHRHAFVIEAADIIFSNTDAAIGYLRLLKSGKMEAEKFVSDGTRGDAD